MARSSAPKTHTQGDADREHTDTPCGMHWTGALGCSYQRPPAPDTCPHGPTLPLWCHHMSFSAGRWPLRGRDQACSCYRVCQMSDTQDPGNVWWRNKWVNGWMSFNSRMRNTTQGDRSWAAVVTGAVLPSPQFYPKVVIGRRRGESPLRACGQQMAGGQAEPSPPRLSAGARCSPRGGSG